MTNLKNTLDLLDCAHRISGLTDLDKLFEAARRIQSFHLSNQSSEDPAVTIVSKEPIPTDILSFAARTMVNHPTKGKIPFTPYPYQNDLLDFMNAPRPTEGHDVRLIKGTRQMGMTNTLAVFALWSAICQQDQTVLIISNKLAEGIAIIDRILLNQNLDMVVPKSIDSSKTHLRFSNGSQIIARACGESSLRGLPKIDKILVDNAAFISYKSFEDFWALLDFHADHQPEIIVQSTPKYPEGPFYRLWQNAVKNNLATKSLTWRDHPERDQAWADAYKGSLGELAWKREMEGEFIAPPSNNKFL